MCKIFSISVCMIVRDEEPVLARCLQGLHRFADEIIIVDTGSVDKTKTIARSFTDKVYDFIWDDDFAAARNYSYSFATCDYIMWLDADDVIKSEDCEKIAALKHSLPPDIDVVYMLLRAAGTSNQETVTLRDRMIRRDLGARWVYPVHEGIPMSFPAEDGEIKRYRGYTAKDVTVWHTKERVNDPGRNLRIFEKMRAAGQPFTPFSASYYCRELYIHQRYPEAYAAYLQVKASQSAPDVAHALPFAVWSLGRLKRWQEALDTLCAAFALVAPTPLLCCEMGECFDRSGRVDLAEFWYLQALAFPFDPYAQGLVFPAYYAYVPCQKLSKLYARTGRMAQAAAYNERALAARPDSLSAALNRLYFARQASAGETAGPSHGTR